MAHARATDPVTSHEAAASVDNVTQTQEAIMELLKERPMTDYELVYRCQLRRIMASDSGIRTRRSELVARGLVADTGEKTKLPSGRRAIIWGLA